jgi:hypothetical protein
VRVKAPPLVTNFNRKIAIFGVQIDHRSCNASMLDDVEKQLTDELKEQDEQLFVRLQLA